MEKILKHLSTLILLFLLISGIIILYQTPENKPAPISLSELVTEINQDQVKTIVVQSNALQIELQDGKKQTASKESESSLSETLANYGIDKEKLKNVSITVKEESGFGFWLATILPFLLPFILIGAFIWFMMRQAQRGNAQALSFGTSRARMTDPKDKKKRTTFADVAGAQETKMELEEVVDFLKHPKKFLAMGAKIPKGVLLLGPPGTGKTLMAKAVAGEAGVPFFNISGSEFVEMFVGVGASRVRDLFKQAKKNAPAIVFIDEIDAVGRHRGAGLGGGHDEREQTLNQILVDMDGFETDTSVIVIAATNRPDVLDPALLRPGRFDRRVTMDLPDINEREQILAIHTKNKPLEDTVKLRVIAERTPGFSGADLYSLMNEAAILAAREERTKVAQFDLIRSIEKVMLGPERRSHILSKKEKELTAFHEAGHAVVASVLPYADPVHKISIIARGRAGGYVLKLPLEDRKLQSKKEFLDDIAVALGGYVVEKNIFGDITTGPSSDLQVATALARDMVTKYGMSEKMGPMALEGAGGKPIFGMGMGDKEYSSKFGAEIDAEVSRMMNDAMKKVEKIIKDHRKVLDTIARRLIEVETIEQKEFEEILVAHGITPKKKKDIEHQA